jgi:hypothetical protein
LPLVTSCFHLDHYGCLTLHRCKPLLHIGGVNFGDERLTPTRQDMVRDVFSIECDRRLAAISRVVLICIWIDPVLKAGVKFSTGSDMCWFYPGKIRGQASAVMFANLQHAGMPPLEIIRAVATNAAEMLGWQDRIGIIEAWKVC